ncbi:hypothetical protein ACJPQX_20790 [Vibrio vulnificus]|uniref:hypothetical protein n=1 Tax=Vibrio TaxID=662 RepID=UPI001124BFE5|nr:hypothetical protein [Vibrio parahaemolyticus]TOP74110.1 hypothetical protein CGH10_22275 [Vibrio parahaemolyticus]TPA69950.1 hypothetical protein DXJ77_23540 [Vibrio parahaemolyticus]HCG7105032.1 hypothetical protein [Vibrio parahaemolyticus]
MSNLFNPDKKFTQSDIAKLLGISDRQVRNLTQQGILPAAKGRDGMNPLACIHQYITYKSQLKSPTQEAETEVDEDEELAREEQRLKLEDKRETIAMKKAKRVLFEKTYGPIEIIVDTLQQVGGRLASRHDSLIPKMKIAYPDLPQSAIEVLEAELTAAVNECTDILPDLSDYFEGDPGSGPAWLVGDEENTPGLGD